MRYALVLTAVALFAPTSAFAADPPITFQSHSFDRVLDDLRAAADLVGGEKAVKAVNKSIKETFGEKGFDGLDISRPIVGYVLLDPKLENITAVIAFPVTGEKEFLALCDRTNREKHKDLGKGLYQLPALDYPYKARLRFSDGYAYLAYGANPEPALDPKAIVATDKLYDPGEKGIIAGKLHFDRLTPGVKLALPTYVAEVKKTLGLDDRRFGAQEKFFLNLFVPGIEKTLARYTLPVLAGADNVAVRLNVDVPNSDLVFESVLTPKAGSGIAKEIAARKPTGNNFAALLTADTVAGFKTRMPLFNDEMKAGATKALEDIQREIGNSVGPIGKDLSDEVFKGLIRTVKTGEMDIAGGVRGPNKDGDFTFVAALAFDDPSGVEKEFKKLIDGLVPAAEKERIKWDADKFGAVNIHTYPLPNERGLAEFTRAFGGDKCTIAWANAPKGIYVVLGPDPVTDIKTAMGAKPAESPVLDIVLNPARMIKLAEKIEPQGGANLERALGKEDKLVSASSLRVSGGKDLSVRFALNLRMLPRALVIDEVERGDKPEPEVIEKK